jgi:hypothetical protein
MRILMASLIAVTVHTIAFAASEAAPTPVPVKTLSAEEARADMALMRRGLEMVHPGLTLNWTYDDGPNKIVKSSESWNYAPKSNSVTIGKAVFGVSEFSVSDGDKEELTMVLDGSAVENNVKKIARIIMARRGNVMTITRMSRSQGEPFIMRDAYDMKRDGD